jgi:hypothetical protein|tara:strand:+ start:568 stop:726 length:159 start_codon:yes stop_codon:yes gene_type:complete
VLPDEDDEEDEDDDEAAEGALGATTQLVRMFSGLTNIVVPVESSVTSNLPLA